MIAVEYPANLPIDRVVTGIRALLDKGAPDLSKACTGIERYSTQWKLTGADNSALAQYVYRPAVAA